MKRKCRNCGRETKDFLIDRKFCSLSCKKLYIKRYYRELKKIQRELYRKYMK